MPETEELEFVGAGGGHLSGVLHRPEGTARGSVLLAHCFTCSKDVHTMTRLSTGLAEAGYAAMRFDFTGLGASGGEFSESTVSTDVGDVVRAATTLIERGYGPCGLLGHSLGGAAALLAAQRLKTVRSLAVLGAPSTPAHVEALLTAAVDEIRREGEAVVDIGGRPFPISKRFLDDLAGHDQAAQVGQLGRPLLVMHAVDDTIVPVEEGEANFAAARQPKAFVPLLDTDHLLTSRKAAAVAVHTLVDWLDQTLGGEHRETGDA